MSGTDRYQLSRFIEAQADSYAHALAEIRAGRKRSHWMWFIFPQFAGLGTSPMSEHYAIRSVDEAKAYLAHPVLGARLLECAQALVALNGSSASEVFGSIDALKLRSSATLFTAVSAPDSVFGQIIAKYFDGEDDPRTRDLIREAAGR